MSRDAAVRAAYPDWIRMQQVCQVKSLEDDFIPSLMALQERGVVVMGLTGRQSFLAQSTLRQVNSLEFDFTRTAPSKDCFVVPAGNPTLYLQGILFVGDFNRKGDVFSAFLSAIDQSPEEVLSKSGVE